MNSSFFLSSANTTNRAALEQYFIPILQIILQRLQNSKTENLSLRFVRFFHFITAHDDKGYSPDFIMQVTEKIQQKWVFFALKVFI